MTEYERVREQAAKVIGEDYYTDRDWQDYPQTAKTLFRKLAAQLLSLNGIEIRADDQSLPKFDFEYYLIAHSDFDLVQQDMLKAGFIKVIPKEEYGS